MSMELDKDFVFAPLPPVPEERAELAELKEDPLGLLAPLVGQWEGTGFNLIWRPFFAPGNPAQDRFLELNLTSEQLEFQNVIGQIPNRGLKQPDIFMFGLNYLQQIRDSQLNAALHFEPGIWLNVPATTNPNEQPTVVRMASIPHGTTMNAQGLAWVAGGPPLIDPANILPFPIGDPSNPITTFPEPDLSQESPFRKPAAANPAGFTQTMVNDPNSVLRDAIAGQNIKWTITLQVSSDTSQPLPPQPPPPPPPPPHLDTPVGGGTANTAFLEGSPTVPQNANAQAALVTATFWIEEVEGQNGEPDFLQLQYTQTVLLNFNTLSWPHVSVATLRNVQSSPPAPEEVDPPVADAVARATEGSAQS